LNNTSFKGGGDGIGLSSLPPDPKKKDWIYNSLACGCCNSILD